MSSLGPHAGFILAAYGAVAVILGGLIAAILLDHRAQKRALDDLERRGIGRRSGGASS
ncbi:heme exporter protein CcmD [Bosea sp. BK604]|uniref:heme exporter protein CcmD n=1 Tax=Bosea sp. BK604 TaxID=2512180 RepID=UPI001046B482|nr:heme exporter protein CcmD [Bosea sp. BK604]TCR60385.1 heme exporter protein D [Bosea sp. BK604]